MQLSNAYNYIIKQLNATGMERMQGYNPNALDEVFESEREEVETLIWNSFFKKNDIELAVYFPKLRKYDGISALKTSKYLKQIPSYASVLISSILFSETEDEAYLQNIKENIDAKPEDISFVSVLASCGNLQLAYKYLVDIYINNENKVNRSTASIGLLQAKGFIKDPNDLQEMQEKVELRKKFLLDDKNDRIAMVHALEAGN